MWLIEALIASLFRWPKQSNGITEKLGVSQGQVGGGLKGERVLAVVRVTIDRRQYRNEDDDGDNKTTGTGDESWKECAREGCDGDGRG